MSSVANKPKRARRSSPRLNPVLPYMTPELWSKVLEGLPYGDIHGLITSDDPNLAIMSRAVTHVERIVVTRPEDLALRPPADALARVKTLTAVCWDDPGTNPWYRRPEGRVLLNDLPIDTSIGSHVEKLIDLAAVMPKIESVWPVGIDWGSTRRCVNYGYHLPQLANKLGYIVLGWEGGIHGRKCAADVAHAIVRGYQSGRLKSHVSLTESDWKGLVEFACSYNPPRHFNSNGKCAFCKMACESLPFRILFPLAMEEEINTHCQSIDQERILQVISSRPGGEEFLKQPSLIEDIIDGCDHDAKKVACTYRGVPIVPGQSGYKKGDPWKNVPCFAGAIHVPQWKLDLIEKLIKDHGNRLNADTLAAMLEAFAKKVLHTDVFEISTLFGRPFVLQGTANGLDTLGIPLSVEKFVVFPHSTIISRENEDLEEDWNEYYDMSGEPSDSEFDEEDE